MKTGKSIAAALTAAAFSFGATAASAATFTFDAASSDIDVTTTFDACWGCGVTTSFLPVASWDATGANSHRVDNFISWSVGHGFGGELVDVMATIAFSTPSVEAGQTSGHGGVGTILGILSGGFVHWSGPGTINFDDGSTMSFLLDNFAVGGLGTTVTTGVTFNTVSPSEVPLPAAGWLLLAGLGGMAAMKRRKAA